MKLILKIFFLIFILLIIAVPIYNILPEDRILENASIDKIIILKSAREMKVFSNDKLLNTYKISLSSESIGDKKIEGDMKTPEGTYFINDKNPNSSYHLNLGISYPNNEDKEEALKFGKSAGGDIKIHGIRNGMGFLGKLHRLRDWTKGCIALTNQEIEEVYYHTPIGTIVEIKP